VKRLIPRWRKMTWVIWIWTAIFAIWLIAGLNSASSHTHSYCVKHHGALSIKACEDASNVGTGIGAVLIFFLWFIGFIVLALIWFMTRRKGRECPVCGSEVKRGLTVCRKCGYDFAAQARPTQTPPAAEPS
jgi:lysylphosphatidylglycerol synthetase-like protein (DUF2156 family)